MQVVNKIREAGSLDAVGGIKTMVGDNLVDEVIKHAKDEKKAGILNPQLISKARKLVAGDQDPQKVDHVRANEEAMTFAQAVKDEVHKGYSDPYGVSGGFTGLSGWASNFMEATNPLLGAGVVKDFTTTSPLSTGFVPFNLLAPTRLTYPVFSPVRNRVARTLGQGTSARFKLITGVSGSQTGGSSGNLLDTAIAEMPAGSFGVFPNRPPDISENGYDMTIPFKVFGATAAVSMIAQVAGQGFEDLSSLAQLILLQSLFMNEENHLLFDTGTALNAPPAASLALRSANATEKVLTGVSTNVYVVTTALNQWGQTTVLGSVLSAPPSVAPSSQVIDVTITPVLGGVTYGIYVATGTIAPVSLSSYHLAVQTGSTKYTLQGAIPTSTATPPTADTGTATSYRMEGIISVTSGWAATNNVYPSGFSGGYVNQSVADTLNANTIATALGGMYTAAALFADPDDILTSPGDSQRLSASLVTNNLLNYNLFVQQSEVANIAVGSAVRTAVNPITSKSVNIVPHPYIPAGTAAIMSWNPTQNFSQVDQVWQMQLGQDYLSFKWPVTGMSFDFSTIYYGALCCEIPQLNGLLQGLQVTDESGTTGTWS